MEKNIGGRMKSTRHINLNRILKKSFDQTAKRYNEKNKEIIQNPRDWGGGFGTTYRRNGEIVVGGYRNILDLGNLNKSQKMTINQFSAIYEWSGNGETPAPLVYFGHVTRDGGFVPGRPWADVAANELNLSQTFANYFNENING